LLVILTYLFVDDLPSGQPESLYDVLGALSNAEDEEIRKRLEDKNLYVRDVGEGIRKIGFTMKNERTLLLTGHLRYN
jgi:hypothetical protein